MACGGKTSIATKDIVRLAEVITAKNMDSIAMKYMNMEWETLENLKGENKDDAQAFTRDVLRKWCYMNSGPHQAEVNFFLTLFRSEYEHKIWKIDKPTFG